LATPFPAEWVEFLRENVPPYGTLTAEEQARLHVAARILVAEKNWEGCGGLSVTDEIRVTVAGLASLLVLGLRENYFDRVMTILVYPATYVAEDRPLDKSGLILGDSVLLGEAHYRGPVLLSWEEICRDARRPGRGRNLVLHEFAHQLDMLNGDADGIPDLASATQVRRWRGVMGREYRRLVHAARHGRPTLLDKYGATNRAEFFAVATECFFLRPRSLVARHPEVYELLREYFGQSPAERSNPWEGV
jgi:hypothetical protein